MYIIVLVFASSPTAEHYAQVGESDLFVMLVLGRDPILEIFGPASGDASNFRQEQTYFTKTLNGFLQFERD